MATEVSSVYLELAPSLKSAQREIETELSKVDVSKAGKKIGLSLVSGLIDGLSGLGKAAAQANTGFQGSVKGIQKAVDGVRDKLAAPMLNGLGQVLDALVPAIGAVSRLFDPLVQKLEELVSPVVSRAVQGISTFTNVLNTTGSVFGAFGAGLSSAFEGTPIGAFLGKIQAFAGAVQAVASPIGLLKASLSEIGRTGSTSLASIEMSPFVVKVASALVAVQGFTDAFMVRFSASFGALGAKLQTLPQSLQSMVGKFTEFKDTVVGKFAGIGPEVGAFVAVFAGIMTNFSGPLTAVVGTFGRIGPAFSGIISNVSMLGSAFMTAGGGFRGLVGVFAAFVSPVGLVVGLIGVLAAAFITLMATNEGFRNTVMTLGASIATSLAPILTIIGQALANLATTVLPLISSMIALMLPIIGQIIIVVMQLVAALAPIITTLVAVLVPIITQIIQLVVSVVAVIVATVMPIISSVLSLIMLSMPMIQSIFQVVMAAVLMIVQTVWPLIQSAIEMAMGAIQLVIQTVMPIIEAVIGTVMSAIQTVINVVMALIRGDWEGAWNALTEGVQNILGGLENIVRTGFEAAIGFITGLASEAWNWGTDIINGIIDGIKSCIGGIGDAVMGVADTIASFLHFSEPDIGPLSRFHTFMPDMMSSMAYGIVSNMGMVRGAVSQVAEVVAHGMGAPVLAPLAGGYSPAVLAGHAACAYAFVSDRGAAPNQYSFGDITIDAHNLEDVYTVEAFVNAAFREGRAC